MDVPTPCAAWMVPIVQDESTHPSLHYSVEHVQATYCGHKLVVDVPVLTSKCPNHSKESGLCIVKVVNGKNFAILKRGLV